MQFHVFINMTCMSHAPSQNDNHGVIMEIEGGGGGAAISEITFRVQVCVDNPGHPNAFSK